MLDTFVYRLNFGSFGSIIVSIALLLMALTLFLIKNKKAATIHLSLLLFGIFIQMLGNIIGIGLYCPLGAFHRYFVAGSLFGTIHCLHIFLNYPHNRSHIRLSNRILIAQYILIGVFYSIYIFATIDSDIVFNAVRGEVYQYDIGIYDIYVAIILSINMVLGLVTSIWRIVTIKGKERLVMIELFFGILFSFGLPSYFNILNRYGKIDGDLLVLAFGLSLIIGFFMLFVVYTNHTRDRTTILNKFVITYTITILILIIFFSLLLFRNAINTYESLHIMDISSIFNREDITTNELRYLLSFNRSTSEYHTVVRSADMSIDEHDMHCSLSVYSFINSISTIDNSNFEHQLRTFLNDIPYYISGYKEYILQYISEITINDNPSEALLERIRDIYIPLQYLRYSISNIPDDNFRLDLLDSQGKLFVGALKSFWPSIKHFLDKTSLQGSHLKYNVLHFIIPAKLKNRMYLRIDDRSNPANHFTTFIYYDASKNILYEAGYSYLAYRDYLHAKGLWILLLSLVFVIIMIIGIRIYFNKVLIVPINRLLEGVNKVKSGNLDVDIPVQFENEFGYLSRSFNTMASSMKSSRQKLRDYTDHLEDIVEKRMEDLNTTNRELDTINEDLIKKGIALSEANSELERVNEVLEKTRDSLWGEMEIARKIQTVLLPRRPAVDGYEITVSMKPADEVGGDYYDILGVKEDTWIIIGDVSGHGITAGLIMMMAQTSIHTILERYFSLSPSTLLAMVNRVLYGNIKTLGEDMFMTISALVCHDKGMFTFSGSHQNILIYRADTDSVEQIETNGMWIGVTEDISNDLEIGKFNMKSSDVMLLYSDGITEAIGNDGEMYSIRGLEKTFLKYGKYSTEEIRNGIMNELEHFDCIDDVTMVVMKRS